MSGMNGVSGTKAMSTNCGMEGMHGSAPKKQLEKKEDSTIKQQNTQTGKIPDSIRGNKFDIAI